VTGGQPQTTVRYRTMSLSSRLRHLVAIPDRAAARPLAHRALADRVPYGIGAGMWRYPLAVMFVVAAYVARELLLPEAGDKSPFQTFVVAVLASAVIGGFGPGLIAMTLSAMAATYRYLPPLEHLAVNADADVLRLGLFILEGLLAAFAGEAVRRAALRERALTRGAMQFRRFLNAARRTRSRAGRDEVALVEALSDREIEVVRLLMFGLRNKEVASCLFVSPNTVKTHLAHIYGKLGVHTRTEAVARALQFGLLADEPDVAAMDSGERASTGGERDPVPFR
jgi:DNA-binding CsgD family transcriptional regulator